MEKDVIAAGHNKERDLSWKLLKQFPGHLYWKDLNGRMMGCNQNVADFFGLSVAEYCGLTDYDLMDARLADALVKIDRIVCKERRTVVTEEQGVDKQGSEMRYLSCKSPLMDDDGNVIGVIGTSLNIDQLKKHQLHLEQRYQESTMSLHRIINLMPGNVYWKDCEGRYLGLNQNMVRYLGCESDEDVIGKTNQELILEYQQLLGENDQFIIENNEPAVLEEVSIDKDGAQMVFMSQKMPVSNGLLSSAGLLCVSVDVTQEKKVERALQVEKEKAERLSSSKSDLILNMSHDLRTPCANILGLSKVIQERQGRNCEKEIEAIVSSSESLLILLEDLLRAEGSGTRESTLTVSRFRPVFLIESAIKSVISDVMKKDLEVITDFKSLASLSVLGDKHKLYRVLVNLISNSVKFCDSGWVKVAAQYQRLSSERVELELTVSDSGLGIPPEEIDSIFDKFHRVNPSYQGVYKGAGVGLYVVHQFITMMKGDISVESELGKGSCFTIKLPLLEAPDQQDDEEFLDEVFQTLNVLIVEDNAIARRLCQDVFVQIGSRVEVVEDAQKALAMPLTEFDVVVLDIGLPDMDGYTLAKRIKEKWLHQAPMLLALTAHATLNCSDHHCIDGLFIKPLTQEKARQMLSLLLD